ncbi:CcmD family protein [Spirosoma telluris]|uniref:CcmD family protein n=1 Tax=Spirosoma telluris TaxID=2183553 RepID=UPI002FC3B5FE
MDQLTTSLTETLRQDGKIWVVVVVIAIVLLGWLTYFLRLGSRVGRLKRRIDELSQN